MMLFVNTLAAALGVMLHLSIFIKGEWHLVAPRLAVTSIFLPLLQWILICRVGWASQLEAMKITVASNVCFYTGMFTSIVIYRLFFHSLRRYPGPFMARITKLWHVYHCRGLQNHHLMEKLHQQYGDYVRIGPNELAMFTAEALNSLDGPKSECIRAPFYDFMLPEISLETTRSIKAHDQRRKVWNQALSEHNLSEYNERVLHHAEKLDNLIEKCAAERQSILVRTRFQWFAMDCISDIVFSESFNTLESDRWRGVIDLLRGATKFLGRMGPIPWAVQIANFCFAPFGSFNIMKQWGNVRIEERFLRGEKKQDWATYAIKEATREGWSPEEVLKLQGDSILLIASGSNPVAATLSSTFHRLAMHPDKAEKLYEEVRKADHTDHRALHNCEYLHAFINEVLRLHPIVLTGGHRVTPPQGLPIGDMLIPGDVTITSPRYSVALSENYFVNPTAFEPERWLSEEHLVLDKRAHQPFGQGRYLCVGRRIAMLELRMITTMLLTKYTIHPAPGEDGFRMMTESHDQFVAAPGPFEAVFERRTASKLI